MVATGGAEALALLDEVEVEAVLLDLMMPGMSGHDVLRELNGKGVLPRLPVLVITALDERQARLDMLKAGAVDFLTKPIDRVELQARLTTAVRLSIDRRAIEVHRDELQQLATDVLDSLDAQVAIVDEQGVIVATNRAWRDVGARRGTPGAGVGANYLSACRGSKDGQEAADRISRALAGEAPDPLKYTCSVPDGEQTWFAMRARPLRGSRQPRVVVSHDDITVAQQARADAAATAARLGLALERLPLVMWEAEMVAGRLVARWVSSSCRRILGVSPEQLLGTSWWFECLEPSAKRDGLIPAEGDARARRDAVRWVTEGGTPLHLDACVSRTPDDPGRYVGFFLDASETREMETALRQAEKMGAIGRLTGGIAHDFNNILGSVLSYATFVRDGLKVQDPLRADVDQILLAARKAAGLTRQLLTFSRPELDARSVSIDVRSAIGELLGMLRRTLGEHFELNFRPAATPHFISADSNQFDRLLVNLVVNARDAMGHGGRIDVSTDVDGDTVRIAVADTGSGMSADTIASIFEPFFTTKPVGQGTGLGLSTSLGIVRDAGGDIQVESKVGEGSVFTVCLPRCAAAPDAPPPAPVIADRIPEGTAVLLVEDDAGIRKGVERLLRGAGCLVTVATRGDDACQLLDTYGGSYDLVFSDVVMPGKNGFQVAEHARLKAPGAAVLLTSGYYEPGAGSAAEDLPVLWKPYAPPELTEAVVAALASRTSRGERPPTSPPPRKRSADRPLVLHLEDDPGYRAAVARILSSVDIDTQPVATSAEARRAIEGGGFTGVLCDLGLEHETATGFLRWLVQAHPGLVPRTLVLSGGALDASTRELLRTGLFQLEHKPVAPGTLMERVIRMCLTTVAGAP